jgi:hypothetical protein
MLDGWDDGVGLGRVGFRRERHPRIAAVGFDRQCLEERAIEQGVSEFDVGCLHLRGQLEQLASCVGHYTAEVSPGTRDNLGGILLRRSAQIILRSTASSHFGGHAWRRWLTLR